MFDENHRFVADYANPHSWLLMADDLHGQASAIYANRDQSGFIVHNDYVTNIQKKSRIIDKPVFLLAALALENAIKAFLVYDHPEWVSNGRLSRNMRSHSLSRLQQQSLSIPKPKAHDRVLRTFESGLDSWFRYPCGLTVEGTKKEAQLSDSLWSGYSSVMRAYGKTLARLLDNGWHGPHNYYGRWTMYGNSLGYIVPMDPGQKAMSYKSR